MKPNQTILTIVLTSPTGDQFRQEVKEGETPAGDFCYFMDHDIPGCKWSVETTWEKEKSDAQIIEYCADLSCEDEPAEIENFYALGLLD